jgi:hypothetical protein
VSYARGSTTATEQEKKERKRKREGKASSFWEIGLNESAGRVALRAFSCEFAAAVNKGEKELGESEVGKKRKSESHHSLTRKRAIAFKVVVVVMIRRDKRGT